MRTYDTYKQKIVYKGSNMFRIEVPDLADDKPRVTINDKIKLIHSQNRKACYGIVVSKGQKHVDVKIKQKWFLKRFNGEDLYDIRFCFHNYSLQCGHYAIQLINEYQLTPLLFPENKLNYNKPKNDVYCIITRNLRWFNPDIEQNDQQKQAILNIMGRTAHPAPYILFGPPGTGKTATLVETVCQIWDNMASSHILICTPSNTAADEITKRLVKFVPPHEIYRMNSPTRQSIDIDHSICDCTNFVEGETVFLPKDMIMLKKIVIVTLISCIRLLSLKLWESHFAYVFIDEAGQATEVESLIPLCLMSSKDDGHIGKLQGQLIMSGDPQQLGPVIVSNRARPLLGQSMLERLMKRPLYRKNKDGSYDSRYITKLLKNYRSHDSILQIPNKLFYEDELLTCAGDATNQGIGWRYLPNKKFPIIFHAVCGEEKSKQKCTSICNMEEVKIVVQYVEKLLKSMPGTTKFENKVFTEKDIAVITPYKLQEKKIEQALHKICINKIAVGTVEMFQGQERNVIILSTVRSVSWEKIHASNIGFLTNPKRFNVALTRAQALLIVVGNPYLLGKDDNWQSFIGYCRDNGGYLTSKSARDQNNCKIHQLSTQYERRKRSRKPTYFPVDKKCADNVKIAKNFDKEASNSHSSARYEENENFSMLLLQSQLNGNMNGSPKIFGTESNLNETTVHSLSNGESLEAQIINKMHHLALAD
ncbi:putative helicase MOV-10 [Cephus cinctus]|uniref:RNA helicase n=1 Tax=Cephus cinctus TaxID=211228 RepID=A0AAJ7RHT7_CEPCN|nr:putative helicase MOV-10 [Cephus cinctus]